jgi:APA family basic amino acid/polyamine antiporter
MIGLVLAAWVLWGSGTQPLLLSIALMLTAVPLYWLRPRRSRLVENTPFG